MASGKDWGLGGLVALVTGGSKGIGRAVAEAFARQGMHVIIAARGEDALVESERRIRKTGGSVTAIRADVSNADDVAELARQAGQVKGSIDVLVNNASLLGDRKSVV